MFNTALRLMGDRGHAEDMLQVSFVRVFHNLHRFRGDSTLGSWIKRVVVNQCLSEIKRNKLEYDSIDNVQVAEEIEMTSDCTYTVQKIKTAMMELPDGYRTIFSLYLLEGYDHSEISDMLSISEATSKSQLSRAKSKVRELVNAMA